MQNFDFANPTKLIFGRGTIARIGEEIQAGGYRKVLLIAGGGSIKTNGVYEQVTASLKKSNIEWIEAWGVRPNPVLSTVREMTKTAIASDVDALLAVGGGSVVDSAKAVAAGVYLDDPWQAFEGGGEVGKALPLYTVLTLSATGSEMNGYSVITNDQEKKKYAAGGAVLFPRVSIIDPSVQVTLPWNQTVNGAIDAISHIMEYLFMDATAETALAVDEALFRTVLTTTDELQKDPGNYTARANLAWAATLALNGVSGAGMGGGDWASHAIEHALSAVNPDVAHGAGLGVVFPAWIAHCQDTNPALFARWARNNWNADSVQAGIAAMKSKLKAWGSPTTLGELGIRPTDIEAVVAHVKGQGPIGAVRKLSEKDVRAILKLASE